MTHRASELRALNAEAECGRAHACHAHDVRALVDKTVARFGRLDGAVNNAGPKVNRSCPGGPAGCPHVATEWT
jgi:NAD(P)-dependent dehydrogenase (short-subunit alcohol dehydrogenase family)